MGPSWISLVEWLLDYESSSAAIKLLTPLRSEIKGDTRRCNIVLATKTGQDVENLEAMVKANILQQSDVVTHSLYAQQFLGLDSIWFERPVRKKVGAF